MSKIKGGTKHLKRRKFIKNTINSGLGTSLIPVNLLAEVQPEIDALEIPQPSSVTTKKVIVAGGGIGGLSCAYELMKKGHEVRVLEAYGRYGGAVLSLHDGLSDGLYADFGAENRYSLVFKRLNSYEVHFTFTANFVLWSFQ